MAEIQVAIDGDGIQEILGSDRGLAALLERVLNRVLEHEITEHVGAKRHERTPGRRGRRSGRYRRGLTTRVGTIEREVPRDRAGTFRTELFERYQRSEKALVLALMEMVVNGVGTRKVKRITAWLCGREFTRSTVSELAKGLDAQVEGWNERPLEGRYPFVLVDAMQIRVRREGAVRSTSALVIVGVSESGYREVLGIRIVDSESEAGWLETFRWVKRETLEAGLADATAVLALPEKYRRRLRTTNMLERLIEELRRRERVIRIFPNERSAWRLLGAFLVEVHESWATGWR